MSRPFEMAFLGNTLYVADGGSSGGATSAVYIVDASGNRTLVAGGSNSLFGIGGAAGLALSSTGGIYGIRAPGLPRPINVAWEGTAGGEAGGALDVKQARIAVGPLTGTARGTLKEFDDGFRLDLAWNAAPVPCAAFDTPIDEGRQFDLGYELRQLAQGIGIAKVSGSVSAHATLAFDSRDLGGTAVTFAPEVTCKLALFAAQ